MNKTARIALAVLSVALLVSAGLNVFFYRQGEAYYLQLNATRLDPLGLSVYSNSEEPLRQPVIVFYGDSRAAQWPPPAQLKNVTILNRGIGSQTTAQVLGRFQQHVLPLKPQIVVLQVGINDLKTIPLFPDQKGEIIQNCKDNIEQLVKMSLESGARVVITTIFPLGPLPIERSLFWSSDVVTAILDVNAYLETLASDRVMIFDTSQVLANSEGIVDPQYSQDFLHLNPNGYMALNSAIAGILVP
jgi:lysophospholipase L1-like esterase